MLPATVLYVYLGAAGRAQRPVGVQRAEPDERPGDALPDHGHDGGDGQEYAGQRDPRGRDDEDLARAREAPPAQGAQARLYLGCQRHAAGEVEAQLRAGSAGEALRRR